MAPLKQTLANLRWHQWLLTALVLLYLLYVALSYLYLPGKLQQVVQTDVAQLIDRDIQVQRIAFNPFALALEVEQFAIADRPEQPLLAWQRLYVNLDLWGSLFGWQLRLSAVELDAPGINIERRPQDFNFSSILARFPAEEKTAEDVPAEKTAFALRVDRIQINSGRFEFDDVSGTVPANSVLDQITIGVHDLYLATGDDKLNPFSLQAQMPGGGSLQLSGEYRADPLLVNSQVKLDGIQLPTFADFIANVVPVKLNSGILSLQAEVDIEQQQAMQVLIRQGSIVLDQLAVDDKQTKPALLRLEKLTVDGIEINLLEQNVAVNSVALDGLQTHQWLKDQGELRIAPLLQPDQPAAQPAADASATTPWAFALGEFRVDNSAVTFTDYSNNLNATQRLDALALRLKNISLMEGASVPITLSATLNDSGSLQVDGELTLLPFALDMRYQLQQLPLQPFNPYVQAQSWLQLQKGTLNVDGTVKMHSADPLPLQLALNLTVQDLQGNDSRSGKSVMQWQALDIEQLQLDLAQRQLQIAQIQLNQPEFAAEIAADKQMNLATLMKPAPQAAATETASAEQNTDAPFDVRIARVVINDGTTRFRDNSVEPAFRTALNNLQFQLADLTSSGAQPAQFSLTSKIDKYAPFTAKGTLAPLDQQPGFAFTSQLQGLEMSRLSPYTGTYIGYQLKSGTLALELDYALQQRRLKGSNNIVANQLYLGDAVASEQAVDAPIGLGLALLRDSSGVIDLDVGVSGDLDDPGFSVSGIVLKALMNVIVKAATSPFQLLGSLVGGSEDLGKVEFAAGSSELDAQEQGKLVQLVEALNQRPQLAVNIKGNASTEADAGALQLVRVRDAIAARRKVAPSALDLATLLDDEDNRDELDDLNAALQLPDDDDREAALIAADPALKGQNLTAPIYQQMLQDVAARQLISAADLQTLADQRALAIKQFLVESAGLDHERTLLAKTGKADLNGRVCELGLAPR